MGKKATQKTIWQYLWSWVAVGPVAILLIGGGLTVMASGEADIADIFFLFGEVLFICKFLTWELSRQHEKKTLLPGGAIIVITLFIVGGAIYGNHCLNSTSNLKNKIYLSMNYPLNCWAAAEEKRIPYIKRIEQNQIIKAPFENRDYCFAVRACNGDDDVPLDEPEIFIQLPNNANVQKPNLWAVGDSNYLHTRLPDSLKKECSGPNEILSLKLPNPERYPNRL